MRLLTRTVFGGEITLPVFEWSKRCLLLTSCFELYIAIKDCLRIQAIFAPATRKELITRS